jgi:NitT/TauT family transport system ATP-binding protein
MMRSKRQAQATPAGGSADTYAAPIVAGPAGGQAEGIASDTSVELRFANVHKSFASPGGAAFPAVENISLDIERGTFNCVIGPSGCGKSTLLNMAAGLMRPTSGEVVYRGELLTQTNDQVGYMTQQSLLLPWRTLEKNIGIALELRRVPRAERKRRVADMLARVGLEGFERRYPAQLSGGMQKRAAIARTLIYEPDTLLMDEPFGALDAQLKLVLQRELLALWERDRKTVIFVTHDLEEAMLLGDRVIVFGSSPGRIIHIENITFSRPRDLVQLRSEPEFAEMWERLWKLLDPRSKGVARANGDSR